jgi:hypothetical protein
MSQHKYRYLLERHTTILYEIYLLFDYLLCNKMHIYCITIFRTMNRQVLNRGMTILASAVLVTTLMMITSPTVHAASPDLTITDFGIDGDGNPFLTVKGTAGGTVPDEKGDIYAYVFFTDDGIYAVTSHPGIEDSDEVGDDAEWHAHKVTLDGITVLHH